MSRALKACFLILFLASAASAQIPTELWGGRPVAAGDVLIRIQSPAALAALAQRYGIDSYRLLGNGTLALLHSNSRSVTSLLGSLQADASVTVAEPNFIVDAVTSPSDPLFPQEWGLQNTGQVVVSTAGTPGADIHAVSAWDISTGTRSNVVAVIDTGVDYTHPDLEANIWSAPTAFTVIIGGQPITCPAGSHGFNVISGSCDPLDDNYHGTHVAGTIGAIGNNATGVTGVNWTASIMGIKFLDSAGSGTTADAIDALSFLIQVKQIFGAAANVRVLNASWGGGGFSQTLLDAIVAAGSADMLFVAAAGNSHTNNDSVPFYPASYTAGNIVSVAATTNIDTRASFSNYGATSVDLGAPGASIVSTYLRAQYATVSGTSMATPHVAGAAALVLSACNQNTTALKSNLLSHVEVLSSLSGLTLTGGRLNVDAAIRSCAGAANPDFQMSATPLTRLVPAGNSAAFILSIAPNRGFSSNVDLTLGGLPAGATASLDVSTVTGGSGIANLIIQTTQATPGGEYPVTVTGTSGSLTRSLVLKLIVSSGFSMTASPLAATIVQGGTTTYTVTLTRGPNFTLPVSFSTGSLPTGVSATFTKPSTSGNSTGMRITTTAGAAIGTFPLTIIGTGGSFVQTTSVYLTINVPDFDITPSPSSQIVTPGGSASFSLALSRVAGFTASLSFSVGGLPVGAVGIFTPAATTGNASTLAITTDPATIPGLYPLTISGTDGNITRATSVFLSITAPNFAVSATPTSRVIVQGSSTTFAVSLARGTGFTSAVTFGLTGLPADTTFTFSPASTTKSTSTLTVTAGLNAPTGTYPLTLSATGGGATRTFAFSLTINLADFSMTPTPASRDTFQGGTTTYTFALTRSTGFTAAISFAVTGLPAGVVPTFTPASTGGNTTTLSLAVPTTAPSGTFPLTITGTGGGLTRNVNVSLSIFVPDFSITATPALRSIVPGGTTSYTIALTRATGFSTPVTFSVTGLPTGASATFAPATTSSTGTASTLTITSTTAAVVGSYTLTVTGTGGGIARSTTTVLNVNAPDFTLALTPATRTITHGTSTTFTATLTRVAGFTAPVSFTVSGLPVGATGTFTPETITTNSSSLGVTTAIDIAPGSYLLTVTATGGGVVKTATATLNIN